MFIKVCVGMGTITLDFHISVSGVLTEWVTYSGDWLSNDFLLFPAFSETAYSIALIF